VRTAPAARPTQPLAPPPARQDPPDAESPNRWRHILGAVDGREGPTQLRVKVLVDDASQAGNPAGLER
jgi:hypothetical protein